MENEKLDYSGSGKKRQLERVYKRCRGICQLCQRPCKRSDASRDHIKELRLCSSQAEARNDNNVQLAHIECNNHKSNPYTVRKPIDYPLFDPEVAAEFPDFPPKKNKRAWRVQGNLTYKIGLAFPNESD